MRRSAQYLDLHISIYERKREQRNIKTSVGKTFVKSLSRHQFNKETTQILLAASEEDVNVRLVGLQNHIRDEIQNYIAYHLTQVMLSYVDC